MAKTDQSLDLVLSDAHIPFHDPAVISIWLQVAKQLQPGTIHLLGDMIDFYAISRYRRDPARKLQLQDELDALSTFFEDLVIAAQWSDIVYLGGNHEERLEKYLQDHAEELAGLRALKFPSLLELGYYGIKWKPPTEPYKKAGLWFCHGDLVRKHSAYSARAHAEKVGGDCVIGHTHRLGASYTTTWSGSLVGYENGCGCKLNPPYVIGKPNWQHGFSLVQYHQGLTSVEQVQIVKGKCNVRGRLIKARR